MPERSEPPPIDRQAATRLAHELNNTLAPVMMSASLLRDHCVDPQAAGLLQTIEACARRGTVLVAQWLEMVEGRSRAVLTTELPTTDDAPRGQGETILLVDDEEAIRVVVTATLERAGYRVLSAANGADGLALFARHRDTVALVLTDLGMPVMDGLEMVAAVRALEPTIRIIASSGLDEGTGGRGVPTGVRAFLRKPYDASAMLRTLRVVLDLS